MQGDPSAEAEGSMPLLWRSQRDTLSIVPLPGLGDGPREALAALAAQGPVSQAIADGGRRTDGWFVTVHYTPLTLFCTIII